MSLAHRSARRTVPLVWVLALAASLLVAIVPASAEEGCAAADHPGGDWPSYGHDLAGTRHQSAEEVIGPDNVADLEPAWTVSVSEVGAVGNLQSTPVVAEGCVYVATSAGWVLAFNADTGAPVWQVKTHEDAGAIYAVAVDDEQRVHVNFPADGANYAAAYDAHTGEELWTSEPFRWGRAMVWSSAIVWDGLRLLTTTGPDGSPEARPGYAILDAETGETLHQTTMIPESELEEGYAGGGVWSTPSIDVATGRAFGGTSNPDSKTKEHRYTNAIIAFDLDRGSPTFGDIVDAYKGDPDSYVDGLSRQPACEMLGDEPLLTYGPGGYSLACVQFDIDMGSSPTLLRNHRGQLIAGGLQKSGKFHAVYADTMQRAWTTILSHPPFGHTGGNTSTAANDGETIYVTANPGVTWALDGATGTVRWATPLPAEQIQNHPATVANGVVYTLSNRAALHAFDAETGVPVLHRQLQVDVGDFCFSMGGAGVTVARNTVYTVCDISPANQAWLVAYRLPG